MPAPSSFSKTLKYAFEQALGLRPDINEWFAWVDAVVGSPRYALSWGAALATTGQFPRSHGEADSVETAAVSPLSQLPAPMPGTLTTLAWHSAAAAADTVIRVLKNGADQGTVTLSGASGWISLASLASGAGVTVVRGDLIHLEYDAGTAPGASVWSVSVE